MFNESEGELDALQWGLDDKDWSRLNVSLRPLRVMGLTLFTHISSDFRAEREL